MIVLKLNAVQVLALSCFGLVIGVWLKDRIRLLERLHIPASIAGGMFYALCALFLRDRYLNLEMDLVLREILMVGFFTTIGMSASLSLIQRGGPQVLLFFAIATLGAILQNTLGIVMAKLFGLSPLLGIIGGSVALTGGPATALAFGSTFESMGVVGASTLGVAAAMFGISAGGLVGGHIGGSLIRRRRLQPTAVQTVPRTVAEEVAPAEAIIYAGDPATTVAQAPTPLGEESEAEHSPLMATVIAIAVAMGIGTVFSAWIERAGLTLPSYVGAMLAATLIRNLDDRWAVLRISQHLVDTVGNVALNVFIVMALLTLQLWQLVNLALPLVVMLVGQVVLVWLMCNLLAFRLMGGDYEAAVMAGGFCGFMLGTTANSMACMDVLTRKYGPAPRAFIVVPIVGAFLIDITNALVVSNMTDLVRWWTL